jgi:Adenylate and Guanylate cyclase catalytic domain
LLETVYAAFDALAKKRGVFKVETIGDCYVAVVGLPTPRQHHAVVMARFARDCREQMTALTVELSKTTLGPVRSSLCRCKRVVADFGTCSGSSHHCFVSCRLCCVSGYGRSLHALWIEFGTHNGRRPARRKVEIPIVWRCESFSICGDWINCHPTFWRSYHVWLVDIPHLHVIYSF